MCPVGKGQCTVAEPRRRYRIPWSWTYIWLWEAWYRPSGRAVYAVDHWAIYPALMSCFCQGIFWEQQRSNYDNAPPSVSSEASVTGGPFFSLSNPLLPTHSQLLPGCFKLHHVLRRVLVMTQSKTAAKGNCPCPDNQHLLMSLDWFDFLIRAYKLFLLVCKTRFPILNLKKCYEMELSALW